MVHSTTFLGSRGFRRAEDSKSSFWGFKTGFDAEGEFNAETNAPA